MVSFLYKRGLYEKIITKLRFFILTLYHVLPPLKCNKSAFLVPLHQTFLNL
nr:MAG TPA: hypothetical protein [Caudoviricetes sp.]